MLQHFVWQSVVIIGTQPSGLDISRDVALVAKDVHLSARNWKTSVDFAKPMGQHQNIWPHSDVCYLFFLGCFFFPL
jgi:cation diffusion facilitator CzcD-associated flavoprotein CzcO